MAKPITPVDRAALERAVSLADQYAQNESHLWKEAASIYEQTQPSISASVVMLRVKQWNIPYRTAKGRRGRQPGDTQPREPRRVSEPKPRPVSVPEATEHRPVSLLGTVYTPAGEPPVKLRGFSPEELHQWSHAVREAFLPKHLSTDGLLYWVNNYFCNRNDNPEEFERIASILTMRDEGDI